MAFRRVRKTAKWLLASSSLSVRLYAWNNSVPLYGFSYIFIFWVFTENLSRKFQVSLKSDKNKGTQHKDRYAFFITSRPILLRMRYVSERVFRENQNTYLVFNSFFENRAVFEIMLKNTVEPGRPQVIMWRMRIACWILRATNAHSEYVTLIAFPRQQWLSEHTSMLRYTYTAACYVFA